MADESNDRFVFEASGTESVKILKRILSNITLNAETHIRIEVEGSDPVQFIESEESEKPQDRQEGEEEEESTPTIKGVREENVPAVGTDTQTFKVLSAVNRLDEFSDMNIIRQQSPDFSEDDSISGTLYSLDNRGLVEKKDHPKDGRKKVYKVTSKGEAALEKAKAKV